jgi:hypothetical protein
MTAVHVHNSVRSRAHLREIIYGRVKVSPVAGGLVNEDATILTI